MALLWRLLLAHFLGDYTFQSEWFFKQRNKYLSRIYHGLLVGIITLLLCLPYIATNSKLNIPLLILLIVITLTHIGIDILKLNIALRKKRESLLLFLVDQSLHLLIIYFGFRLLPSQAYSEPARELRFLTFIVFAMWAIPILVRSLNSEIKKVYIPPYAYFREEKHGLCLWERGALFLGAGLLGYYLLLLPLAILPRLILKANYHSEKIPLKDWLLALITGFIYLLFTRGIGS